MHQPNLPTRGEEAAALAQGAEALGQLVQEGEIRALGLAAARFGKPRQLARGLGTLQTMLEDLGDGSAVRALASMALVLQGACDAFEEVPGSFDCCARAASPRRC